MQYLLIIILFICCIIFYNIKKKDIEQKYIQKRKKYLEEQINSAIASRKEHCIGLDAIIEERQRALNLTKQQLAEIRNQRLEAQKDLEEYKITARASIDSQLAEIKQKEIEKIELQIAQTSEQKQRAIEALHTQRLIKLEEERTQAQQQLDLLIQQVGSYQAKQEAINSEIRRQRELEEKVDFYRVCLSKEAIADINELQSVRQKLKKPEIIDKIIYDNYIAKPVLEMIKRVLQNSTYSGIYKITCQVTKEVYIGKSTDIKNRWQQHCKTAFNCGTIASSLLHRKMQQYGIENFTFELLEVVPKDQLSEREKFYINFYQTKEVGLNERNG